jgi:hypothetical protein
MYHSYDLFGKNASNIREPSSGGIGIKETNPSVRLHFEDVYKRLNMILEFEYFAISP